jgi:hypothetical protein
VALEPSRLDFGTNLPGVVVEKTVDIVNLSNGNLHYQLAVKAVSDTNHVAHVGDLF